MIIRIYYNMESSSIVNELKLVIDVNIPDNKKELVWIVNNFGNHLFNVNIWNENNIYKNEEMQYPQSFDGLIKIIDNIVKNPEEKSILIKYLFGKSLEKLNKK